MENLKLLMSEYLHQDWQDLYADWPDAVTDFVAEHPEAARIVPTEIDALLSRGLDSECLSQTLTDLGTAHDPTAFGQSDAEWLTLVRRRVLATLAEHHG